MNKGNDFVITSPDIVIDGTGGEVEVVMPLDTFAVDVRQARLFLKDGETPPASQPVLGIHRKPGATAGQREDRAIQLDASQAADVIDLDCSFDPPILFVNGEGDGRAFAYLVVDNTVLQATWIVQLVGTNRR